ncbi:MarR family winged helix-turn-helix transcriptional regulator [Paucilactobacillus nenjiangensis]|jgi:DNA-binding MarR family transcriptional regulator|uniref:MarR family transcriptional regulator n=1 Tax=Paucilactobacillus nenjiangensis TaxID=1296540 RepID=A0A5P1X0R3_9LACO|nr:MarR family transcriptional regulator [Paucilactobacillus nenjiangensis]QER67406.1 MarR family transcriptional regulator [Paucilactobacillus nenjiangensis]
MKDSLSALTDISKNHKSALLRITKQVNLTIAEWQLLLQIIDGNTTQDLLSKTTGLDTSTLSRQLKHLETKEMLDKTPTGRDKRQLIYAATELGVNAVKTINEQTEQLDKQIFDRWTEEETNLLQILLNRLDKSVKRILSKTEK